MSPRAACRLEALEFEKVYDYVGGIADWKAAGRAVEGDGPRIQTAVDAMRPDIPTCDPSETIGEVGQRVRAEGWEDCVVLECGTLVVGRLRASTWDLDPLLTVGEVMQTGPSTVRANGPLSKLVERMDRRPTPLVVVATPQGELLGVVLRDEAKRVLSGEPPEMVWAECEGCPGQWRPAG